MNLEVTFETPQTVSLSMYLHTHPLTLVVPSCRAVSECVLMRPSSGDVKFWGWCGKEPELRKEI
jgi:hypothetical protein